MAQRTITASEDPVLTLTYLARVVDATATLCLHENQDPLATTTVEQSGQVLIRQIAENLLQACGGPLITSPLPKPLVELEECKIKAKNRGPPLMDPEEEREHIPDWKMNRSDYLRCVLRGLPPIALDVAAHVVEILVADSIPIESAAAALVLFSKWLPIAPQLAPLVSDLFALDVFPCPLEYGSSSDDDKLQLLVAEAAHAVYEFYAKRGDHSTMTEWWPCVHLFSMIAGDENVVMRSETDDEQSFDFREAIRWHAARAIGFLIDLRPAAFAAYLDRLKVRTMRVPWMPHPWMVDHEEERAQFRALQGVVSLFDFKQHEFPTVSAQQIRTVIPLNPLLVHVGEGIVLVKNGAVRQLVSSNNAMQDARPRRRNLILTPTTSENMALLGAAMCSDPYPLPILVCGPPGSGKSSLVRELAHYCCASGDDLLELHVDEETDSKTLIGSYTTTDTPGEFTWRPGALTQAVRSGKWVLMEDVDTVPTEIQAAIVQLLEDRMLPLGGGKFERCHPLFRLFGTCTISSGFRVGESATNPTRTLRLTGKKLLNPSLWRKVHVQPLAFSELKQIGESLHPLLPPVVAEAALNVLKALDRSGRADLSESSNTGDSHSGEVMQSSSVPYRLTGGRHASVRDFLKLLSRISNTVAFEHNVGYATEAQRTLCLAETVDVFAASCPSLEQKREFITQVAAPHWGITGELAQSYMETRQPAIVRGSNYTEIGRAKIPNASSGSHVDFTTARFAPTNFSLRLMESIGVCITENEPTLLVGETGCGKTTLLQQLARYAGRELIVQNLSLQTDSTDLLGGYRPLEIPHIARKVYLEFVDIFVASFSRKQNADFLKYTSSMLQKRQWKKLAQCFTRAAALGLAKIKQRQANPAAESTVPGLDAWRLFCERAQQFERQRLACDSGLAFAFTEGALVDAIRSGKWVLLDEINLASSETLQRLCGLLDDSAGSVTLTERGDSHALKRHPDFRLFAAMNPATDAGKKDLPLSIRARFSELYVDELLDAVELRTVAAQYLRGIVSVHDTPLEHTETVGRAVDIYLQCRDLAEQQLVDAAGHKPRYTMRTMCRALSAARNLVSQQKLSLTRSMLEGFELAFEGALDTSSTKVVQKVLRSHLGKKVSRSEMDHPPRRPSNAGGEDQYVLVKPFWLKAGPLEPVNWSEGSLPGRSKFILTESMLHNLRRLSRAVAAGPWPVLLEGPTSAGKTTLVEYLAARCGHEIVRINNHEHTDVQEYTGGYSSDANGSLSFHDGLLVQALRKGHWVILDELNLAPSEVLEALNRLLDDNRELYLPEIDETVKPHPNFRLFATQNPSGAYGGRKPLSRAFRNRFVELHMGDIPAEEMRMILEKRCSCPPSHAKALVKIMIALRQRRNAHGVFLGKDGLITPRDLLRWAERGGSSKLALAQEGYMLLAERLRSDDEKTIVKEEIEAGLNVVIDCDEIYYGEKSEARAVLARSQAQSPALASLSSIAPTKSLLRLLTLVDRCARQKEPVLLVGETGCGKTTVVQLLSEILNRDLHIVNCHATTETSDLIGGLRPVRGRATIAIEIQSKLKEFLSLFPDREALDSSHLSQFLSSDDSFMEEEESYQQVSDVDENAKLLEESVPEIASLVETLHGDLLPSRESSISGSDQSSVKDAKKRKLACGNSVGVSHNGETDAGIANRLSALVDDIKSLSRRLRCLFEWADGPLVDAMRMGHLLLLDEMSLAEDAVLERLNSVLEPSRTIVLAEKGTDSKEDNNGSTVVGHEKFLIFATMNPGGDFGKRELSPALRSRFTEIWVPQVTDSSDIELVLGHTLASVSVRCDSEVLKEKMLSYVAFFNNSICGDKSSPCMDLVLSLRDVLAWARFVVDVSNSNDGMDLWALYCHGACLMHLDGLGLGTGLSLEDARYTKRKAISFLLDQVPFETRPSIESLFRSDFCERLEMGERFGIPPFMIEKGQYPIPENSFDFNAPTPSLNLLRLLRAMQISKPILLEGSPGVGKTSLAAALAAASGHRLVRINLSEQTDMSDLMGSDLPNPEQVGTGENGSSASGSSFRWCDGILLRAIKQGDWVLLDELNLASQSVLEGLNSCLDHRASVFIPELGKTFRCPPTFRIFAAQNPLAQGGGRKGLPKSFLNRFTKVYVESLTEDDLHSIVSSRFPKVPKPHAKTMILFNKRIHDEVVDRHEYGAGGSPWEFNLRDVFRWCELVDTNGGTSKEALAQSAKHLYLQRFRTVEDRRRLDNSYQEYFGISLLELPQPEFNISDEYVNIGCATLERSLLSIDTSSGQLLGEDPVMVRSLLDPLEAVATCTSMKWPCLLVGSSGCGKSSLLSSLAELCNAPLVNVSLTPATDVNELVGSFEQVDSEEDRKEIIRRLYLLRDASCTYLSSSPEEMKMQRKVWQLCHTIRGASVNELVALGSEIVSLLESLSGMNQEFCQFSRLHLQDVHAVLRKLDAVTSGKVERDQSHFRWVDGILVAAMTRGYWLHLENANLCPASVLDRLNSVMEKGGELLLTECGVQDSESNGTNHQVVKPHPDFRVFLSMDPEHGEISRAMRNRCVEISLLSPSADEMASERSERTRDSHDLLYSAGVRSMPIATSMLAVHDGEIDGVGDQGTEPRPSTKHLRQCGDLVCGLSARGLQSFIETSYRLSYELSKNHPLTAQEAGRECSSLLQFPSIRWGWSFCPDKSRLDLETRIVKVCSDTGEEQSSLKELLPLAGTLSDSAAYREVADALDPRQMQKHFLALYLGKSSLSGLLSRSQMLDGYPDPSRLLRFMASLLEKVAMQQQQTGRHSLKLLTSASTSRSALENDELVVIHLQRLVQLVREQEVYKSTAALATQSVSTQMISALEASVGLSEGRLDRSSISCPVTPMLYPFFRALDEWIYRLMAAPESAEWTSQQTDVLESFLTRRDQLWLCLQQSVFNKITRSNFLGFNECGFIVQWVWLKKQIGALALSSVPLSGIQDPLLKKLKQQVDILMEAIDLVLFNTGDGLSRSANTLWKKGGHPVVPRLASQWEAMAQANQTSRYCTLLDFSGGEVPSREAVELHHLVKNSSPALFLDADKKGEMLAALCMCFWATTDEVVGCDGRTLSLRENEQLCAAVGKELRERRQVFASQVHDCRVDTEIATVENLLDVDTLSNLKEHPGHEHDEDFLRSLMFRFAQIQVSPIAEFWCVQEEIALVDILAETLASTSDAEPVLGRLTRLVPRVRTFINVVLSQTSLAVVDVRPYQTLLWAITGEFDVSAASVKHLIRCVLPRMMNSLSCHTWSNSFNDLDMISDKLEMPSLWICDEMNGMESSETIPHDNGFDNSLRGPPGLRRSVKSEVVFRLIGATVSSMFNITHSSSYATIENYAARKRQAQTTLAMLSTLKVPANKNREVSRVLYLFTSSVEALIDFFPGRSGMEAISILRDMGSLRSVDKDYMCGLLAKCEHPAFRECLKPAVFPLLVALQSTLNGATVGENLALCWIHVGLLRMTLLVPRSPLDPGTKPTAKVVEHDRYLHTLAEKTMAMRLDGTFVQGVPPDGPAYHGLLAETKRIEEKRRKQERKRVERASSAPPFIDLFRESRRFFQSMASPEGIPALVRVISEASQDEQSMNVARTREYNWQVTSGSFCSRFRSHFAPYEDVALPFVNAIENVRDGIRLLAEQHLLPRAATMRPRNGGFDSLLAFPTGNVFADHGTEALVSNANIVPGDRKSRDLAKRCRFAISLASLYRIDAQKLLQGGRLEHSAVSKSHSIFSSVAKAWSAERDGTTEPPDSEETLLEKEYREQFPDHGEAFHSLLQTIDMGEELDQVEMEQSDVGEQEDWRLANDQIAILSSLHRDLYMPGTRSMNDRRRLLALCAAYSAAFHLAQVTSMPSRDSADDDEQLGAHIATLGLCSSSTYSTNTSKCSDFHRDPNPAEVARASHPLDRLISRVSQLLNAFPGHSVLLALVRVADHCRKLPLSTTSIGKAMHGLEVILRRAQEWEQHASSLVKLGTPLREVSELVASWRKLELQSWNMLLDARGLRFEKRAQRHWPRLYNVLIKVPEQKGSSIKRETCSWAVEAPVWVWKGVNYGITSTFSDSTIAYHEMDTALLDLSRVMDTFLLSSSLGEFRERLYIVETFAHQISLMCDRSGHVDSSQAKVGRMLSALFAFYRQFVPMLESRLSELRRPIEARLKDEVKLAKWDEQSYYALRESTEKNHRKLMKLLREYDDVLELSVSSILEKQLCHGVRVTESSTDECCSSIPPYNLLFPFVDRAAVGREMGRRKAASSSIIKDGAFADPLQAGIECDKYISRMGHYARRMATLLEVQNSNGLQWSRIGKDNASMLCDTIFERIDSLRKESATKAMKQRALVDLFKTLKKNGFLQTKWSVPEQAREMAHLFQLPGLVNAENILSPLELEELEGAERYFQRTTAEVNRLRSEVQMLGSKHMSQRETQIMLSLSEHGLTLICQQRCVLARFIQQLSRLDSLTTGCDVWKSLPAGQRHLRDQLSEFNKAFISVVENLKQLQLLMKTASPLVEEAEKVETIRDMIVAVDSCLSLLGGGTKSFQVSTVVTAMNVSDAEDAGNILEEVDRHVCQCQEKCERNRCFPPEIFRSCIEEIRRSRDISSRLSDQAPLYESSSEASVSAVMDGASLVIQKVMLAVQGLCKGSVIAQESERHRSEEAIFGCHSSSIRELASIDLDSIAEASSKVIEMLVSLHDSHVVSTLQRDSCTSVVSGMNKAVRTLLQSSRERLVDYIKFSRSLGKLSYVLARVFRVLVSKGYCADNVTNDEDGDGGGDISGMNFDDDKGGIGMGEGDGKKDVTDQLESEEQLLGLKGDDQGDAQTEQQESRELNEEEAKQGMEMEGEFEGDMFDVPEQSQDDDDQENDDDKEELDREMGDGPDKNEDIIDEKLWDESDDEGDQDPADEKFEKDSGVQGDRIEDEMRTRDDDETRKGGDSMKENSNEAKPSENDDAGADEATKDEPEVNDDLEDKYEEKAAGVDVRSGEDDSEKKDDGDDEPMELEDGLNLDEGSDDEGKTGEDGDAMDTEDLALDDPAEEDEDPSAKQTADDGDADTNSESSEVDADLLESGIHNSERNEDGEEASDKDNADDTEMPEVEFSGNDGAPQEAEGIYSKDGKDNITDNMEEDDDGHDGNDGKDTNDDPGNVNDPPPQSSTGGTSGEGGDSGAQDETGSDGQDLEDRRQDTVSAPNPCKSPGDATKFWHRKLRMLDGSTENGIEEQEARNDKDNVDEDGNGEFEFAPKEQASSTQVLGDADEEEASHLDKQNDDVPEESADRLMAEESSPLDEKARPPQERQRSRNPGKKSSSNQQTQVDEDNDGDSRLDEEDMGDEVSIASDATDGDPEEASGDELGNRVVTDLSQLNMSDESLAAGRLVSNLIEDEEHATITDADVAAARSRWSQIQGETYHLARRLCEKLRLVMEPLVATKLKGDYRTGKRINMKRVIGYIASGYRKDKIWLRRTKPAKRNYRVLLAVDNSESMNKSGAGTMALAAMATLAVGMSQLEIGELGVASFGEEMRLLHPFHQPFTSESGVNVVQNFPFDEKRTRTALCVESAIEALDSQGDATSMQLVFLISDGRIERDSRDSLRRLVREMVERNILLVMIIVEGDKNGPTKKKDSIIHMKEVTFKNGKPNVKQFIDDYPFPYYMVLEDMQSLPELLGGALSQWFEMIAQVQGSSR